MSYRDHLARKGIQPVTIERTKKRDVDYVLDTWSRPSRLHGAPIERLPFVQHDDAPVIDTVGSALSRAGWEDWLAVLVFAAGAVVLIVAWAMVS